LLTLDSPKFAERIESIRANLPEVLIIVSRVGGVVIEGEQVPIESVPLQEIQGWKKFVARRMKQKQPCVE
jgi:hypothetical protein